MPYIIRKILWKFAPKFSRREDAGNELICAFPHVCLGLFSITFQLPQGGGGNNLPFTCHRFVVQLGESASNSLELVLESRFVMLLNGG